MNQALRGPILFAIMGGLLMLVGFGQSWSVALSILNLCLISSIMALGLNMQWGYAGLFNVGVMSFTALGGVAAVLVSKPPVPEAWEVAWIDLLGTVVTLIAAIGIIVRVRRRLVPGGLRMIVTAVLILVGYGAVRIFFDPAVEAIEETNPAKSGYLGGLNLPIILAWPIGGLVAAGAAWMIAKVALGLRADYLAIATLGISEIVLAILKNEDWLARGVKNVTGLDRPVPYEVDLQESARFREFVSGMGMDVLDASTIFVKLCYASLFLAVLVIVMVLAQKALHSPWGRMMRAIRDNEAAAAAMGKNVTRRHLEIFVIGAAVVGMAGAMLTTLDGQFTPGSYQPLRFTFLIWVMVIVGGSGNNWGAVLGGFFVWFIWVEAEPAGLWLMEVLTSVLGDESALREHLIASAPYMRVCVMGLILLLVLRFSPRGLIPDRMGR
ncbi:MAG: branched-chain amino acid ABC transporter permease [Rhodospirillales bacterium]|nr:branched-chain amino acid ABC transporter permease [Rhodospirillales bacterium]